MPWKLILNTDTSIHEWVWIDFSIIPNQEDGYESDEEIEEEHLIDYPDDICAQCFTKLRWINLYYQCPDCKRIYG